MTARRAANDARQAVIAAPERYVRAEELADLMGVSPRTIARMVAAGMPSETWGMSRTRRFLPSQSLAWAQSRSRIESNDNGNSPGGRVTATGSELKE